MLPPDAEIVAAALGSPGESIEDVKRRALAADEHRRIGTYDKAGGGSAQALIDQGVAPIGGGATGMQGAAFMHNLPPEGTYIMNSDAFFRETERNDVPQETKAYTGLGGAVIDQRISNIGVLSKLRMVFTGSLVVAGAGTCTATPQFPFNILKNVTLNANGQTSLINASGMDLRARSQRIYRNVRDPLTTGPALTTGTESVKDPAPGVIANGTYPIVIVYDLPICHDDYTLTGSLFAQSDQTYLNWRATPAQSTDLFVLAGGSTAALTGSIQTTLTFFDIPYADMGQEGRKVLIPDLQWLHGYLANDQPFAAIGDVKTPFIRTAGQLLSFTWYYENGLAAVIDPTALSEIRFEYGGNRRPRVYSPPAQLLMKNVQDYNGRILPASGYICLDFEVDNPRRDIVYPKGVTELLVTGVVPGTVTLNANSRVHFIEETLFAGQ